VLAAPGGKSCYLELGYARASGKPAFILLNPEHETERYEVMPNFATAICSNMEELISTLDKTFKGEKRRE
jgi:nucleoside 2-deoxyribosyltransferase